MELVDVTKQQLKKYGEVVVGEQSYMDWKKKTFYDRIDRY